MGGGADRERPAQELERALAPPCVALGISEDLAETRYRRMKDAYRRRMAKLGLLPDMMPLRLIVSGPRAISRLRGAA